MSVLNMKNIRLVVRNVAALWQLKQSFWIPNAPLVNGKKKKLDGNHFPVYNTTMKVNQNILDMLTKVAIASDEDTATKLASAVVMRNKIISVGVNRNKSHPFQKKFGKNESAIFWHAEVDAIKTALKELDVDDLAKCDLYIARVKKPKPKTKEWVWGLAKPCCGCQRAIEAFGIRNVVYTTDVNGKYEVM